MLQNLYLVLQNFKRKATATIGTKYDTLSPEKLLNQNEYFK